MSSSAGVVDWPLAERSASLLAGAGAPRSEGIYEPAAVAEACTSAIVDASAYCGLAVPESWAKGELIERSEWSRSALASLAAATAPLEQRIAAELSLPGPLGGLARRLFGAGAGAEAGLVIGYAAKRVIGQYDVAIFGEPRPARLLLVRPNLEAARLDLDADAEFFLRWIALHETTHVLQLESVPWLLPHIRELAAQLLDGAGGDLDANQLVAFVKRLAREPRELVRSILRGELAAALADPAAKATLDRLQATMAVIEGHAEHVMDACAAGDARLGELRHKLERRRSKRVGPAALIGRLLGIDLKLRQYALGKRFWDAIVSEAGSAALELPWRSSESLPDLAELENPGCWLARADGAALTR